MQVSFETVDFGAEEASRQAAAEGGAPAEPDHLWGAVLLSHPGQPTVSIKDDLSMLGLALCVDVPAGLVERGEAVLRVIGWPEEFAFKAEAGSVQVTGSLGADARFPQAELLAGLAACGQRLGEFMRALAAANPQFAFSARALRDNLAAKG